MEKFNVPDIPYKNPTPARKAGFYKGLAMMQNAIEAHLGCSIEEAKAILDRTRLPHYKVRGSSLRWPK